MWAEGLLDAYVISNYDTLVENGQLVSKSQYFKWYNELPTELQEHVIKSWGDGLGNGSMIYREKAEINKKRLPISDFKMARMIMGHGSIGG